MGLSNQSLPASLMLVSLTLLCSLNHVSGVDTRTFDVHFKEFIPAFVRSLVCMSCSALTSFQVLPELVLTSTLIAEVLVSAVPVSHSS